MSFMSSLYIFIKGNSISKLTWKIYNDINVFHAKIWIFLLTVCLKETIEFFTLIQKGTVTFEVGIIFKSILVEKTWGFEIELPLVFIFLLFAHYNSCNWFYIIGVETNPKAWFGYCFHMCFIFGIIAMCLRK